MKNTTYNSGYYIVVIFLFKIIIVIRILSCVCILIPTQAHTNKWLEDSPKLRNRDLEE
jgi:hypothetical protein